MSASALLVLAMAGANAAEPAPPAAATAAPAPAASADPAKPGASVKDIEALIQRMQKKLDAIDSDTSGQDRSIEFLAKQVESATGRISGTGETNEALRGKVGVLDDQVSSLATDRSELSTKLDQTAVEADARVKELSAQLAAATELLGGEQQTVAGLRSELEASGAAAAADEEQLTAEIARLRLAVEALEGQKRANDKEAETKVADLAGELDGVRRQLTDAEARDLARQQELAALNIRLNATLAYKVEELSQYRSEFFGRLRQLLGDRQDMRIEGDRFVFQSEVLFASGSSVLDEEGKAQLVKLAQGLKDVLGRIPPDIDWILRVDGHTDRQPIVTDAYLSNWDLSTRRAIAVVEYLVSQGIPPQHLAATGFGEYQPLDAGDNPDAYRRNRRIEFKLTER